MNIIQDIHFTYGVLLVAALIALGYGLKCEKLAYPPNSSEIVKEYVIDLDVSPELRWKNVIQEKSNFVRDLFGDIEELIKSFLGVKIFNILNGEIEKIGDTLPSPYREELKGMAQISGLPFSDLTMYNIFYELFALCTSIVAEDHEGNLYHGRNLDNGALLGWNPSNHTWKVTEHLKSLTILTVWKKEGKTLYKSVGFAGYVGVLTAMKENKFSFSLNKRMALNNGIVGLFEWLLFKDHHQHWVSFKSREVMETAEDFLSAKKALSEGRLIAPVYYIITGVNPGEGAIITRDRDNVNVLPLGSSNPGREPWFVVQTNYDYWRKPPFFDDRRGPAVTCLKEAGRNNASLGLLYNVLSTKPVLNKGTVYTSLLRAQTGMLRTWIRSCPDPCALW